jgi:hypothetical protein
MATLFRRGKIWWIDASVAGQRLRWSVLPCTWPFSLMTWSQNAATSRRNDRTYSLTNCWHSRLRLASMSWTCSRVTADEFRSLERLAEEHHKKKQDVLGAALRWLIQQPRERRECILRGLSDDDVLAAAEQIKMHRDLDAGRRIVDDSDRKAVQANQAKKRSIRGKEAS